MKVEEARYSIAEISDWFRKRDLVVNSEYQRGGGLWTAPAKTYFIDTILRGFPFPKVYFHEKVDRALRRPHREIVDGQQRIATIVEFIDKKFRLGASANEFEGLTFDDLSEDQQDAFYGYTVAVDVVRNAERSQILQMFRRMNSYTLPLNEPEKRQSSYFGEFKTWINSILDEYGGIIVEWNILSSRQIVRMLDTEIVADLALTIKEGIVSTSPKKLNDLYRENDRDFDEREVMSERIGQTLAFIRAEMPFVKGTFLTKTHMFHSLVSALVFNKWGLPNGEVMTNLVPIGHYWSNGDGAKGALLRLAAAYEEKDTTTFAPFVEAASEGGNRAAQRAVRVSWLCRALRDEIV